MAMYPSTTLFIALGQFAIVVLVLFSYPLQVHPCRNCLDKVFRTTSSKVEAPDQEGEDLSGVGQTTDMTRAKHTMLTYAIVISGFAISYFVDDLQMGSYRWIKILCIAKFVVYQSYLSLVRRAPRQFHSFFLVFFTTR